MHIRFLTENFPPEVNAPASRTYEHCREWVKAGHQVTVITCAPNFPKGRVFDGYKNRIWQRQTIDGIEVIRVWTYITANEGFARRVIDYLSFMFAAILAGSFVRKVDIVVGTSPPVFHSVRRVRCRVPQAAAVGLRAARPLAGDHQGSRRHAQLVRDPDA